MPAGNKEAKEKEQREEDFQRKARRKASDWLRADVGKGRAVRSTGSPAPRRPQAQSLLAPPGSALWAWEPPGAAHAQVHPELGWWCGSVPVPWFGTKARYDTFVLVTPESLSPSTSKAPGTASSNWPNGVALHWESRWLVRAHWLLILEDAFSVMTLFCRDQQTFKCKDTLIQHESLWPFSVPESGAFAWWGWGDFLPFSWGTAPPPRALPISTSQVIWDALVPTMLGTFSEFKFLSWRFSFQYDPTKAQFFYLLKLGSPMLFTLSIPQVFTLWTLCPLCCAPAATVQGTQFPHLWRGYDFVISCNTVPLTSWKFQYTHYNPSNDLLAPWMTLLSSALLQAFTFPKMVPYLDFVLSKDWSPQKHPTLTLTCFLYSLLPLMPWIKTSWRNPYLQPI